MKDRLEELIVKYWSQTLTVAEQKELEQLLVKHPEEWIKMGLLHQSDFQLKAMLTKTETDAIADQILQKKAKKKYARKRSAVLLKRISLFSLFLAGISLLFFFWQQKGQKGQPAEIQWRQVTTTDGMKTNLRLSDGTEIWLNAGSSLKYPETFDKVREVYLSGEAYFSVRHQPDRPFIIHTAKMDAKVLGTELDVRAYPDEEFSATALISGAVKVILKKKEKKESFYLKPRQKIIFHNHPDPLQNEKKIKPLSIKAVNKHLKKLSSKVVLKPVKKIDKNTIPEIAWRKNIFIYENETFASLAKRLSRWYGVQIVLKDSTLAEQRFTGRADNVSLKKLLHILQMLKPFRFAVKDNKVVIY